MRNISFFLIACIITFLIILTYDCGAKAADPQKQTGKPFIKIREVTSTIETAQKFHNKIVGKFRKKNPTIQSTFSLWMLHSSRFNKWRGYKNVHTILDSGILPDDVMLCMDGNGGRFDLNEARAISRAGRKVGIWGWYLADKETRPSMHVCTNRLGNAFRKLPADAHNLIEWYSMNSNSHRLNMGNLYVAGKLMRNPRADARAALRKFIAGAFGRNQK